MGKRGSSTLDPWLCNYSENLHIFHSQNPRKLSNKPQRVLCHNHFLTEAFSLTSTWHFNDSIFDPHSNSANWPLLLLSSFWIGGYLKIKSHFQCLRSVKWQSLHLPWFVWGQTLSLHKTGVVTETLPHLYPHHIPRTLKGLSLMQYLVCTLLLQ